MGKPSNHIEAEPAGGLASRSWFPEKAVAEEPHLPVHGLGKVLEFRRCGPSRSTPGAAPVRPLPPRFDQEAHPLLLASRPMKSASPRAPARERRRGSGRSAFDVHPFRRQAGRDELVALEFGQGDEGVDVIPPGSQFAMQAIIVAKGRVARRLFR